MHKKMISLFLLLGAITISQAQSFVTLYGDCDYRGSIQTFRPGRYKLDDSRIGSRKLSSIRIPNGLKVVLYTGYEPGQGNKTRYTSDQRCLSSSGWNDMAVSMVVESDNTNDGGYYDQDMVTIYRDCNLSGRSQTLSAGYHNQSELKSGVGDDEASSLRVPRGWSVTIYRDPNYKGLNRTYTSDENCFDDGWNNSTSSVFVSRTSTGQRPPGGGGGYDRNMVTVYEDCNYGGRSQTLSAGYHDQSELRNGVGDDRASSIRIPRGWSVTIYRDPNYKGLNRTYTSDESCFDDGWNNSTSSIFISRTGSGQRPPGGGGGNGRDVVTVFADCGYRGRSQELSAGYHDISELRSTVGDDNLSSIRVPSGWNVTIYKDPNFKGSRRTFYADAYCLELGWNNTTSSIFVARNGGQRPPGGEE